MDTNTEDFIKKLRPLLFFIIAACIILSAWHVLQRDILFHTDIARDFLVLDDIVKTHKPTLLGPRSGGIPGMFHGPLWLYLNLPAFLLGKGDPVIVGWFWVCLAALSVWITYYCGKKIFNKSVALIAALLYSVFSISYTSNLLNPYGAVLLFPLFFYLFQKYLKSKKIIDLTGALFTLGLIIQFQIAFGGPILVLSTIYLILFLIKKKKKHHLFSFLILLIPLASYILFDLRHDLLQSRAILNYLAAKQGSGEVHYFQFFLERIKGAFIDGFMIVPYGQWFTLPVTLLFGYIFYKLIKGNLKYKDTYYLFFYFYLGFWIITLAFKGVIWGYYFWPFLPLIILVFSSAISIIDKKIFLVLFLYVFLFNFYVNVQFLKLTDYGWNFYQGLARDVYKNADGKEFGYFVYSPDEFGYSEKYAMIFAQNEFRYTKSYSYTKKDLTYLLVAPAPKDKPWINGEWWRTDQVKIDRKADHLLLFKNGTVVYKYILSDEEQNIPSDPNLIQTLIFR